MSGEPSTDPFPIPTVPELDSILRRCLPHGVVFAIAPQGDPFTGWARYMLEGRSAVADCQREVERLRAALLDIADFVAQRGEMVHPDPEHPAIGVRMVSVAGVRTRVQSALAATEPPAEERP